MVHVLLHVGAAEGCDLLILILKNKIKRSQPSAAPTGDGLRLGAIPVGAGLARDGAGSVSILVG
ncbi:hypothetical protein JFT91_12115 [Pseudomonas sp. TH08]|uniref:hypothetical protein n=1 Tax=Pseudomonas sp. TH08 TaxID=2796374 RepID=UPI00191228E9|nr:hypothetical protein [Pseudomonas sp. TH08]MBK5533339.1 hypothetical protein [Pseudomonas sp. TH08]